MRHSHWYAYQPVAPPIRRIGAKPRSGEKLKGRLSFLYSYHFNHKGVSYRIIYEVSQKRRQILIRLASSRENLYRRLGKMRVKPLLKKGGIR